MLFLEELKINLSKNRNLFIKNKLATINQKIIYLRLIDYYLKTESYSGFFCFRYFARLE